MKSAKAKITFSILLILGLFVVGYFVNIMLRSNDDYASEADKDEKRIEVSKYPGVDLVTEITEKKNYNMAIHYPKFKSDKLNTEMEGYASSVKEDFLAIVEESKEYIKDRAAVLSLAMEIHPVVENVYSIVFSEESYVVGANAQQKAKVYIVDAKKSDFIQKTKILKDTKRNREQLYALINKKFKESKEYSPLLLEDGLKIWAADPNNKLNGMYFTDKAAVFQFDKYEVTAGAAGMPKISIPLDEMQNLLTDEWKEKLQIENDKKDEKDDSKNNTKDKDKPQEDKPVKDDASPKGGKRVALTFDDGPHPKNTLKILDLLEKYDAKATFFMLGNRVDFYPEIVKEVADQGHELGNHTWNHKDLTTLSKAEGIKEVERTNQAIKSAAGRESTAFRPPYGAVNKQVQSAISSPTVFWTIDTLDWKSHNPAAILNIVQENVRDGSIILMHDIHATTSEAVESILKYLKKEGYEFVSVSEL
ncbi:Peptidoglycan/xylan/chitin deacetylase, PgdA/CDA1 family [Paenibacillus uliginis N3/975]|uniref:Peptidoglycan/xylan/chitin deacetylase, PgdA/CDA1 family n=1 Tax=Paenibacillus uliginis N3/975 TaxID=1313296 RepID=A0A1X7H5K2_9BACL|nr:polysaccharide deacetylase family protein [Paenibacillus uliginis]SMF79725.1 Peptidoglycan/xylan/chitin deacetylase, PgdA/CDA1 family [Paenibacillus uliginis N3/975]